MPWTYDSNVEEFIVIPVGKHRVRIKSAEETTSKNSGNPMVTLELEVSGYSSKLWYYIPLNASNEDVTNRMLKAVYKSFSGIAEGNTNWGTWVGHVGACTVKHEEYNGSTRAKVGYFIPIDAQKDLPAWKSTGGVSVDSAGYVQVPQNVEVPFD